MAMQSAMRDKLSQRTTSGLGARGWEYFNSNSEPRAANRGQRCEGLNTA